MPSAGPPSPALPAPLRTRWQPLRIGLVDLFYYDVEEFWFRDGRLLLRGNNGTGKSKVLALTLPFLLDGEFAAHRVEPDGDPKKRMEWNLLLGGEHPHSERLGYTWIEFGRRTDSGNAEYRTLGCGMKAAAGRGMVGHWFFVTPQRVGPHPGGLSLVDGTRTALSHDRLREAVEGHGMVYRQAGAYRRAVDEALFGLGEQRYGALVDLLIQLRQPQLSKRPDPAALSKALTRALPPMDAAMVADVAEAFRSLDEEKAHLAAMLDAKEAAGTFLRHYRGYARVAARRRARLPRVEHSRYEQAQRNASQAQSDYAAAQESLAAAETRLAELDERWARLEAEEAALRAGPEMRSARELEQAGRDAERARADAERAVADRDRAAGQHDRARDRLHDIEERRRAAAARVVDALERADQAAGAAGLGAEHARAVAGPLRATDGGAPADPPDASRLARAAEALADRRDRAVTHAESLAEAAERAAEARRAAVGRAEEAAAELAAATERATESEEAAQQAGNALVEAVRRHVAGCVELAPDDPTGMLDRLQEWTHHLDGPYPARAEAAAAHRSRSAALAAAAASLSAREEHLDGRRAALAEELATLEAGGQPDPRPPHTRAEGARDDRPGAPLWRLVDFAPHLPAADRAGLEAALEAAGLLDAWVLPDGTALDPNTHDTLLTRGAAPGMPGPSLTQVLHAAHDPGDPRAAAVSAETVTGLLAAVGYGEQPVHTWVDATGRYAVGALRGAWAKESAGYIGEGAREEARRARMATLRAELDATDAALADVRREKAHTEARRATLDAELAALPEDTGVREARARGAAAAEAVRRTRAEQQKHAARAAEAAEAAERAAAERAAAAADLGLPEDAAGLRAVRDALAAYRLALAALWPAVAEHADTAPAVASAREDAEHAATHVAELTGRAETAAREAVTAAQRHETLASTVGTAVAELQRRLAEVAAALRDGAAERSRAQRDHTDAVHARGEAGGRIKQLEDVLREATRSRDEAIAALRRFAATGLLELALPEPPASPDDAGWTVTQAVQLARAVEATLKETDDSDAAWERVQRRTSDELTTLQEALSRHGHSASGRMVEDGLVVDVLFQGKERAVPELATALEAEVDELQRLLSAREREILENHLVTEVAGSLQELLGAAEQQVRRMNDELADRPTSTGMVLRLVWRTAPDAPPGLDAVRERLRQSADAWSPEDRAALGAFLQEQIETAQKENPADTWLEHLTTALDYRSWHQFAIERRQHGRWRSATGPASGGERVLTVSVPLFAAASSHYATAHPHAPRLVTLDEAFAGVDDDARAKCLGLLHAFDLDVVMTSEREWACYPEVPGVAIAQLSRVEEVAAVLVTRWEWDGRGRVRGREPRWAESDAAASLPAQPTAQDELWV